MEELTLEAKSWQMNSFILDRWKMKKLLYKNIKEQIIFRSTFHNFVVLISYTIILSNPLKFTTLNWIVY